MKKKRDIIYGRPLTKLLLFVLVVTLKEKPCTTSVWDSLPFISQTKSLFQAVTGDVEGARKTQENFVDTNFFVGPIKSAIQGISGDHKGAEKSQAKYVKNLENIVDSLPVVGHIKGGIHVAAGDKEHGLDIIKGASSSTGSLIGGLLGGPAGAVVGGIATDGLITGIDSAVNKDFKPYGTVHFATNIDHQSAGNIFDQVLSTGLDVGGGLVAKGNKIKSNKQNSRNQGFGVDSEHVRGQIDDIPDSPNQVFGMDSGNVRRQINDVPARPYDPAFIETARRNTGLEPDLSSRLKNIDFMDVNDIGGGMNCYMCSAAAFRNTRVSDLITRYSLMVEADGAFSPNHIVEVFQEIGYPNTRLVYEGTSASGVYNILNNNISPGHSASFALAFRRMNGEGHVINMRAWQELNGKCRILTTDYQIPAGHPNRFAADIPQNMKSYYVILPLE